MIMASVYIVGLVIVQFRARHRAGCLASASSRSIARG